VLVGSLRKKVEPNPATPRYILTEPWVGYRFADLE
jgi:two-component system KDP operon response regulator KdpE